MTSSVGFLPGRKVFLPCHGEKNFSASEEMPERGEQLPDVFILRCNANPCVSHGITKYICTGIQLNY